MAETQHTPSEAIAEFYKDEIAAGTLSQADLATLQQLAEERSAGFNDRARDAGQELKGELLDALGEIKQEAAALKEADADGKLSGQELAEHGAPVVERVIDIVDVVDGTVVEGAHEILDASRDIIEARAEMDGADPAVIDTQLRSIEQAEADVDDFADWRQEQRDQARDVLDAKMEEIEDVENVRDLPHQSLPADAEADLPIAEA
jgi:hypothetical protein